MIRISAENRRKTLHSPANTYVAPEKKKRRKMTVQTEELSSPLHVAILHHIHDPWEPIEPLGTGEPGR